MMGKATTMKTTSRSFRRHALVPALAILVAALAGGTAFADKVILFKNGKSMRAKTVKDDKGWSRLEIDGGVIGVKSSEIALVQEASGGSPAKESLPNQAAGGGGGYGAGYVGGGGSVEPPPTPAEDYQPPQSPDEARGNPYRGAPQGLPSNIPGLRNQMGGLPSGAGSRSRRFGGLNAGTGLSGRTNTVTPTTGAPPPDVPPASNNSDDE